MSCDALWKRNVGYRGSVAKSITILNWVPGFPRWRSVFIVRAMAILIGVGLLPRASEAAAPVAGGSTVASRSIHLAQVAGNAHDAEVSTATAGSSPLGPLDIQFDGGYSYDDNINRASSHADILSDQSFSVNVSNAWVFPVNENSRALVTAIVGGEKFRNYNGLSRVSGGLTGELQYRASAAFDAPTLALSGKTFIERFESDKRDGHRYSVGISILQPLTDRITAFGALTYESRYAKSAVFDGKHHSARINFDYALHKDGTVYLGGEYRRGDIVSTARPSLANLDIAKVFTQDDVFGKGFTSYRFDAKTWIATVGYNLGFGPRDSLDLSWRRAQSTPTDSTSFPAPGFRYVVNQFNVVYLKRF